MFGLGATEIAVLLVLGLFLFGNRLPDLARSLGKTVGGFRNGMKGLEEDLR